MPVRLQFVCERALSSEMIAWFSAGHFSHVDAVMPDGSLLGARDDRLRGIASGVQIRPPDYASFSRRVVFDVPANANTSRRFHELLMGQIGKPYDSAAIWGFVTGRDWREPDSWICSELQAWALEASGIAPKLYLAANKITPVSLALVVSALGATTREKQP